MMCSQFVRSVHRNARMGLSVLAASVLCGATAFAQDGSTPNDAVNSMVDSAVNLEDFSRRFSEKLNGLYRLTTDDDELSRTVASSLVLQATSFGEVWNAKSGGYFRFEELPEGWVVSQNLTPAPITGENYWSLDIKDLDLPSDVDTFGISMDVFTATVGNGPEHFGLRVSYDAHMTGEVEDFVIFSGRGEVFFPIGLVDPTGPASAMQVGEFVQYMMSGAFDAPGALTQWVGDQVLLDIGSKDGSSGVASAPPCETKLVLDCLSLVGATLAGDLAGAQTKWGSKISELEKKIVEMGGGFLDHLGRGAVLGGIGGLLSGAKSAGPAFVAGGPLGAGVNVAAQTLLGATVGAFGGMFTWAWTSSDDIDKVTTELEEARKKLNQAICAALCAARNGTYYCLLEHCPKMLYDLMLKIDLAMLETGCAC